MKKTRERARVSEKAVRAGANQEGAECGGFGVVGAGRGAEIVIEAEGWDAKEALDAVAALVEAGFHEE